MRITWGPDLQLGHRVIDGQHEELINLLNELDGAVAGDGPLLADVLRRLDAYVLFHFSTEESLMRSLHQPEWLAAHRDEHRHFIAQMAAVREQARSCPAETVARLAEYLTQWLREHILVSDRRLVLALNQHAAADRLASTR